MGGLTEGPAAEHGERGRTPVVVIDESHLLTYEQLEAIRMLTNDQMDAASPMACLLIGQPTLRRMLRLGVLAAPGQRIALRYAMPSMTAAETTSYITHHLKLAGRSDPLFSDDAITLIHEAARGLPRAVNNIALQALVAAYAGRKALVDEAVPDGAGFWVLPTGGEGTSGRPGPAVLGRSSQCRVRSSQSAGGGARRAG